MLQLNALEQMNTEINIMKTLTFTVRQFYILDYTKRRWVEFSEAHRVMSNQPTKIPPAWNGWLCNMYDDIPNVCFIFTTEKKFR